MEEVLGVKAMHVAGVSSLPSRGRRVDLEMFLGGALVGVSVSSPALPLLSSLIGPICKARDPKANPDRTACIQHQTSVFFFRLIEQFSIV